MAFFNPSNQLLQIDTGKVGTYLYQPGTGPWAGLGENQVLGQRYFGVDNVTAAIWWRAWMPTVKRYAGR